MNRKKDTAYGINRLESKNARAAIIQKISADFNLMPLVAEAYYKQISYLLCATRRRSTDIRDKSVTRQSLRRNPQANTSL